MIYKKKAYDIIDAAQSVTLHLLENTIPSQTIIIKPNIVQLFPPPVNLVYGSTDQLEADIFGCSLLGKIGKKSSTSA